MSQHDHTVSQTRLFLENMVGFAINATAAGHQVTPSQIVESTLGKLLELTEQHFPLAKILDASDIVFRAEGPGAATNMPWLSALNWVSSTAERNIRDLSVAYFEMRGINGKKVVKGMDTRLTGIAPGSLWMGVKVGSPSDDHAQVNVDQEGPSLVEEIRNLPAIARFIDNEGMLGGIEEVAPDPAMRDISLNALLRFSPTGQRGIHTLEIATHNEGMASLGQRERVVLKEAIDKPDMQRSRHGSFVGEIRAADLDRSRMMLRAVQGVGTLRCVIPDLSAQEASRLIGRFVCAVGSYQVDRKGRPRLMFVERFEEPRFAPEHQLNLPID